MTPGRLDATAILDLSPVLAGPSCTQMLDDLGADGCRALGAAGVI